MSASGIGIQTAFRQIGAALGLGCFVAIAGSGALAGKSDFDGAWLFMAIASAAAVIALPSALPSLAPHDGWGSRRDYVSVTVPARGRRIVLAVHLVATLALLGVSIVMLVAGLHAASREDPGDAHAIYALLRLLTVSLDLPLASIALLSGVSLAVSSSWGIFRHWWVIAKQALFIAILVLGVAAVAPSVDEMLELTGRGDMRGSGASVRLAAAAGAQVTLLLAAAALAVFKPGGGVRRPRRRRLSSPQPGGLSRCPGEPHEAAGGQSGAALEASPSGSRRARSHSPPRGIRDDGRSRRGPSRPSSPSRPSRRSLGDLTPDAHPTNNPQSQRVLDVKARAFPTPAFT